jgi:oligopeptidase A
MNPFYCYNDLPDYAAMTPELAEAAITDLLHTARTRLAELEESVQPTWEGCMAPRYACSDPIQYAWGIVSHMLNAMNSPEWRRVHEKLQPSIVGFFSELGQNQALYKAMRELSQSQFDKLDQTQKRILENELREAEQAGAGCSPDKRARLTALREQNAADSAAFMNHTLDASKVPVLTLKEQSEVQGLPDSLLSAASEAARRHGHAESTNQKGPWVITHEAPLFIPFMQYSERRKLREALYRAYVTRASSGDLDNAPLIANILNRRKEIAQLLGFQTYAHLTLEGRMAKSTEAVDALLERIRSIAKPAAQKEHATLQAFANANGQGEPLAPWDIPFWSERLRKQQFSFDSEALRAYFPFPYVLNCLWDTVSELFGVTITPTPEPVSVWHPDVLVFAVRDEQARTLAYLYLDPYSRPETKRGGAWMDCVLSRDRKPDGSTRLPAALMVCNQARPSDGKPALMTLQEVTTLYHECGHALQHILTTVDLAPAAGINNVEWDAVELPSQFMENWVYHRPFLKRMTKHVENDSALPDEIINQVIAARWFQSGYQTLRQVFFAAVDMRLHSTYDSESPLSPDAYKAQIAPAYTVIPPLPEDRFLCGFSHIFAGGYAAGYYSYKWAEVLAADAFAAFEEAGLDAAESLATTGRRFRQTVLSLGGSRHPMEIFRDFRGRDPDPDALLRQSGLLSQ